MPWPSPQDYNEAIQNPRQAFADPELQNGHPELNLLGLPRPITGAFASVYKMQCEQRGWAVRCFLRDLADQQQRYTAINQHLDRVRLPYTVDFTFLPQGIRVRGQWHPILKMEWIQGDPLNVYIEKHLGNSDMLLTLAGRWIRMIKELQQASIAHGDLQHGNILVVGGELRLVDYDGMYVPALSGKTSHEAGHRNYQHPSRTERDFGLYLDNFSAWVIYLSLLAFSIEPGLWHHLGAGDECLLFRGADFNNPESSIVFLTLERSQNSQIQQLASLFRSRLQLPLSKFPPFDEVHIPSLTILETRLGEQPGWLSDYVPFDTSKESVAETIEAKTSSPGNSWIRDHVQSSEAKPVTFDFAAISDCFAFLTLIGALLLLGYSLIAAPEVIFWSCTVVVLVSGIIIYRYRIQSVVQTKRQLSREIGLIRKKMVLLERGIEVMKREKQSINSAEKTKLLAIEKRNQSLLVWESREIREADEKLRKILVSLNSSRNSLKQDEAEAMRKVRVQLQSKIADIPRQRTAIDQAKSFNLNKLYKALELRHANIQGVGTKLTGRLLKAGIAKASDITHPRVSPVEGFGDVKTAAVLQWRKSVEVHVQSEEARIHSKYSLQRQTLETQESTAKQQAQSEEEAIRRKYTPMVDVIDREEQKTRSETKVIVDGIRQRYRVEHNTLDRTREETQKQTDLRRKDLDSKIEREQKSISAMCLDIEKIQRQFSMYNQVTFGMYLRRVFMV